MTCLVAFCVVAHTKQGSKKFGADDKLPKLRLVCFLYLDTVYIFHNLVVKINQFKVIYLVPMFNG